MVVLWHTFKRPSLTGMIAGILPLGIWTKATNSSIVASRFLLQIGRLISYHRNRFGGRTSIIARPGEAAKLVSHGWVVSSVEWESRDEKVLISRRIEIRPNSVVWWMTPRIRSSLATNSIATYIGCLIFCLFGTFVVQMFGSFIHAELWAFSGFPFTPVWTAEYFAEFDGCPIGVLLYPRTLDASMKTMLLILPFRWLRRLLYHHTRLLLTSYGGVLGMALLEGYLC